MAELLITANKSSAFLERISDGLRVGAGADHHMPASPNWAGHRERSAVGFSVPASTWDGMAEVDEVALLLTTTGSGVHIGRGSSPECEARRITESWTPNGDSMDSGSATTSGLTYPGPSSTSTNAVTITSSGSGGEVDVVRDITKLARAWMPSRLGGSGSSCYGLMLLQGSSTTDTTEYYSARAADSWKRPQLRIRYTALTDAVPNSPALTAPVGQLVPAYVFAFTNGKTFTAHDIQVGTDKTFATGLTWDERNSAAGIAVDGKSASVPYTGAALTPATVTYWWRARCRNATGWGAWSSAASFTLDPAAVPSDQLDQWADTILADLAAPRRHTILGTIVPRGSEVLQVAATDYAGRWYLQDANHGSPIAAVVELVGMTLRVDADNGWSVDATTHDLGGAELLPPDYVPLDVPEDLMPLKTWVDYERLESADLNAAFAWSQDATLPGAWSTTDGPNTASIASSAYGELRHGAPPAGQDPLGIYQSGSGRLLVPIAGIWMYRATCRADDSTTNDAVQLHLTLDAGRINIGSIQRRSGTSMSQTFVWVAPMAAGQPIFVEARMLTSAGVAGMRAWSLVRLGRGVGPIGAVALALPPAGTPRPGGQLPVDQEDGA